jgi:protein-S-isoprenylcysteine O-methyltransferase Ste14
VGLAICGSSWLSLVVILAPIIAAFLYRIHVEERALLLAFPSEYREYSERTSRIVPGLY